MIQILQQRYFPENEPGKRTPMIHFKDRMFAQSVQELFENLDAYLERIPKDERYNLHYTIGHCEKEGKARQWTHQNIIPFDIDGIDVDNVRSYVDVVIDAIGGLSRSDVAVIHSGNGLHFLIGTTLTITDPAYFGQTLKYYKVVADRINLALKNHKLPGETDTLLWAQKRTLRLPGTDNVKNTANGFKTDKPTTKCKFIQKIVNYIPDLEIKALAYKNDLREEDTLNIVTEHETQDGKKGKFPVDTNAVISKCPFLVWCFENPDSVNYGQWIAALTIVSRLENGRALCHQMSEGHRDYSYEETEAEINKILVEDSPLKPYKCSTISNHSDKCRDCPHKGKIKSPISIKGEDFIKTRNSGFRNLKADGSLGKANYRDLIKYFESKYVYFTTDSRILYVWENNYWRRMKDIFLENFVETHLYDADNTEVEKFVRKLKRSIVRSDDFFADTTFKRINLKNGVLCMREGDPKLLAHDSKYGFSYCLDYDYDPEAKCPTWDKFMLEVTDDREDLVKILEEFAGYAFASERCIHGKALILLGKGKNGKSTWVETLQYLVGRENFSPVNVGKFSDATERAMMVGKLFNISDETPKRAFSESADFKQIITGGTVVAKLLYHDKFNVELQTKIIMNVNDMPASGDITYGFLRRLLIVPFDRRFEGSEENKQIKLQLIEEAPGILNRIIEGFIRLRDQNDFTESAICKKLVEEYAEEINPVAQFVKEFVEIRDPEDDSTHAMLSDLHKAYRVFCEENNYRWNSMNNFSRQLSNSISNFKARKKRKGEFKQTALIGIKLIDIRNF